LERTRPFRRLRTWRVGIKARLSHLQRGFGCGAPGCGAYLAPDLGRLGVFASNLQRMTVAAAS
jgi:transposase, IS5 family